MTFKSFQLDQIALVNAISNEINSQNPDLPFESSLYNKIIEAANIVVDECKRERVYATSTMKPRKWLESDDVGESSRYMLTVLACLGYPMPDGAIPHDADDLGRCIRMVNVCELEAEIPRLYEMGSSWKHIAKNWSELKSLYEDSDYNAIYNFLNESEE
jgi:hypothetical protein